MSEAESGRTVVRALTAAFALLLFAAPAFAQAPTPPPTPPDDSARDADIFGEPDEAPASADSRDDDIFGGGELEPVISEQDIFDLNEDILQIGGQLYVRFAYSIQEDSGIEDNRLSMPNLLDVYLDARPTDRIRAYVRGRLSYDPTLAADGADPLLGDLASPVDNPRVLLDQLWLKFDIARAVFVTIGKQPAKWGTGRIWNPLDFLNDRHREPLAFFDERTGPTLVKLHIPIESLAWNFYAVAMLDEASSLDRVGVAGRAEFVVETAELALSARYQKGKAPRFGFDFSAGVWDFDIYGEVGLSLGTDASTWEGSFNLQTVTDDTGAPTTTIDINTLAIPTEVEHGRDEVVPQVVAGVEYAIQITDDDVLYAGVEYFYNHLGYANRDLYPFLLMSGAMEFFYTGRHYGALYLLLPSPGSWEDTSFGLSAVGNFSDETFLARFDFSVTLLTWLRLETYVAGHFGQKGGELRFALDVPAFEIPAGIDVGDFPIEPGSQFPGISVPPMLIDLGINLRVAI